MMFSYFVLAPVIKEHLIYTHCWFTPASYTVLKLCYSTSFYLPLVWDSWAHTNTSMFACHNYQSQNSRNIEELVRLLLLLKPVISNSGNSHEQKSHSFQRIELSVCFIVQYWSIIFSNMSEISKFWLFEQNGRPKLLQIIAAARFLLFKFVFLIWGTWPWSLSFEESEPIHQIL